MTPSPRTSHLDAQPAHRRRRAAFQIGAGLAVVGIGLATGLILQSRERPQVEQRQAPAPTIAKPAGPTYVVENTLFGRRVRLVAPENPATSDQIAQAK